MGSLNTIQVRLSKLYVHTKTSVDQNGNAPGSYAGVGAANTSRGAGRVAPTW